MKKVIIAILIIGIVFIGSFFFSKTTNDKNEISENYISVEEYENESYLQNIIRYKLINNTASNTETMLVNVINDNDIQSIKKLFFESDKIENYSYDNEVPQFCMIAYLFDNSAIKIEGVKDEVKVTSLDDESTLEYYKFRLEKNFQEYLKRKYQKYAKNIRYFLYKENDKYGVIDEHQNKIIEAKYDNIKIINDYVDLFVCTRGNKKEILDINKNNYFLNIGEKISEIDVKDAEEKMCCDILTYEMNKKYGLLNVRGEKISDLEYSNIQALGKLKNYIILEKENSKKQLCKVDLKDFEIMAEYDEFLIKYDEETQEYIISGKNEDEDEQVIHIEKNKVNNYPEILGELVRVYENGMCFYIKQEINIENTTIDTSIITNE